eukprot:Seg2551.3 transcript_id=Seg2551.3/GoldUCD/mRNA.D3Y31 product="Transmembrane protein 180" protein_id=Seg2551.3/GoldUCD/D3Y31
MQQLRNNAFAYSATTIAAGLMNSVFQFYYVTMFLNVHNITQYWFNQAQVVYLIWNAINDPLFGYLQDNSNIPFLKHRRLNILYGAPLFALSFLLPWFGWAGKDSPPWVVGLHLIVSLCFYDGMFTFVVLAQCSLFAEISSAQEEKELVLKYSQVASIIGSSSVLFCELGTNHMKDQTSFKIGCVVISIISYFLLAYSGRNLKPVVDRGEGKASLSEKQEWKDDENVSVMKITKQVFTQRDFVCFVTMNFFQVFHVTVGANFFAMFREYLITNDAFPQYLKSIMAGSAFVLPQIIVLANGNALAKYGSYTLIQWSFYFKVLFSLMMYLLGPQYVWTLAAFMLIDMILPSATFSLFNLSVSDIIEQDRNLYKRRLPISSMVFGLNALVTKPAQSIAPVMVVYILSKYGYKKGDNSSSLPSNELLRSAVFNIICFTPAIIGTLQIIVWRLYTLRKRT